MRHHSDAGFEQCEIGFAVSTQQTYYNAVQFCCVIHAEFSFALNLVLSIFDIILPLLSGFKIAAVVKGCSVLH